MGNPLCGATSRGDAWRGGVGRSVCDRTISSPRFTYRGVSLDDEPARGTAAFAPDDEPIRGTAVFAPDATPAREALESRTPPPLVVAKSPVVFPRLSRVFARLPSVFPSLDPAHRIGVEFRATATSRDDPGGVRRSSNVGRRPRSKRSQFTARWFTKSRPKFEKPIDVHAREDE
jgi:hypothetical protein